MENEIDQQAEETAEVEETETNDVQEEVKEEKPELTLEQQRGILQRKLTKINKKLGIVEEKPQEKETPKNTDMSLKDIRALSDVHDEDVEEIVNLAKLRNISVAEAKKDQYIIAYLKTRIEERASAANTNTNTTRRTNFKTPNEELIKKVKNNEDMTDDEMKLAARQMVESFNKR